MNFIKTFKAGEMVYLEDSVLWYCLQNEDYYNKLTLHQKINFKQSYFTYKK